MHVYCSGIGGVGIGPLAMLALDSGFSVSGSDLKISEMTAQLIKRGANVAIGQDGSQIKAAHSKQAIDWFVYSSALSDDHPELLFAQQHNIKTTKRDEFITQFLGEHSLKMIAVAGTHGKTTTTGMIIWLCKQLNVPVSYSVGTTLSFGPPAQYVKESSYFVYEADEFDRNFLHFQPAFSAIVSCDYDHVDTYPTKDEYRYAFSDFIAQTGHTLMWQNDADTLKIRDTAGIEILSESDPGIASIALPGEHVRRNAWLAVQTLHQALPDIEIDAMIAAMQSFPGTNRRFEKLANNLYSDYAHHPTEISATLQLAKEVNPNVVILYQPHQNIRQHEIMNEGGYTTAFVGAKHVYWLPTYLSREHPDLTLLTQEALIASTTNTANISEALMNTSLANEIRRHISQGDLVVGMSAGDLDAWLRMNV